MTNAQHRTVINANARLSESTDLKGAAPHGMWWVAWRQHRMQVLIALGFMAAFAAAMSIFRVVLVAEFTAAGCSLTDPGPCDQRPGAGDLWSNSFSTPSELLHLAMTLLPVVIVVFVAAPVLPREFAQGTHVFALTQSVGRWRWWAAKVVVVSVAVVLGLLALGVLLQWVDGAYWATADQPAMSTTNFATRSIVPAAYGLVAVSVALAAGIAVRRATAALVIGLLVGGIVITAFTVVARPHLLPTTRSSTPVVTEADIDDNGAVVAGYSAAIDPGALQVRSGYLLADRREVSLGDVVC